MTLSARYWEDSDGNKLEWPALLSRLQDVASTVVAARPDIDAVVVFGIDVTPPLSTPKR